MEEHTLSHVPILRSVFVTTVLALWLGIGTALFAQQQIMVTNTADAGAGSLRQAILDANSSQGANDIVFSIPDTDPGQNGLWWTITLAGPLPEITDSGTHILGSSQTANQGDRNSGSVGTGGTVGVAEMPLPTYELPEIAINASGFDGLTISGAASDIEIEGLSIYGGRNGIVAKGEVMVGFAGENRRVHGVLVGPLPDGSGPGEFSNSGHGIVVEASTSPSDVIELTVDSSYVGLNGQVGIVSMAGPSYVTVRACEVFLNGHASDNHDGIDVNGVGAVIEGNLSWGNANASGVPNPRSGNGIEAGSQETEGTGNFEIVNNTTSGNLGGGIGLRAGASFSLVGHNIVKENAVGIHVNVDGDGTTAHNRFTENRIFDNDGLGIDLHAGESDEAFDGVTLNSPTSGTAGANLLVPYPVITEAVVTDRVLRIKGFAQAGGLIELYEAAPDPSGFGEGKRFIISFTEGEPGVDMDDGEGTYGPQEHDVTVSTEELTANRFEFTYELGDEDPDEMVLTATQSLSTSPCLSCLQVMSTSEFGPNIQTEIGSGVANESQELPNLFSLYNAYPNPFNPSTTIRFDLERTSPVLLRVYGARGTLVGTLVNGTLPAGPHAAVWNATDLPSGIYFYRIEVGDRSEAKSVLLLK